MMATVLLFASGCGSKAPADRHAVSGTVNLDKQPVATGSITFFPDGTGTAATGGTIHDGKFTIPKDQGLPPGSYKVSITATVPIGPVPTDPNELIEHPPDVKSIIPKNYNSETTLSAKVEGSAENVFTFNLESK